MSRRQAAIEVLRARLAEISTANGYQTDAGQLVFLAEGPALGPDDPESAIAVDIRPDLVTQQGRKVFLTLPVSIQAHARIVDATDPWGTVEAVLADIKKAIEQDNSLEGTVTDLQRGLTETLRRENGSSTVGAAVEYRLVYEETWGRP